MSRALVLIVEDDPDVASFLEAALSDEYETRVAFDGVSAQRLLEEITPDLVVLDVRLPCMSGPQLCRMIRNTERLSSTPLLVVTGYPESAEAGSIREMGVDRILAKPVTPRRLRQAAKTLLRGTDP
ncbi:response regulator [Candidatus Fermentibacteria bacterium]|nr:response regulator [Candidatus Fermentibacteria bacterium]